ncbi:BTB/POZ domain-containing protein 2 isoform X2 [Grus americana]|uniref:BTB/POZ domain-containing protein 2 isoform X2 n=1 Tax=Grus americana TaxID=9117 RepID=UPI0024082C64|nr:BTB/POZ domain-containing protein 2 isoform X2 [Grus americana]
MRRCCPALCISTSSTGSSSSSRRGAARPAAIAAPLPPAAAVSRPPLLVLVLLQRRPAPPAPAPPPHKMAAGGSGGGPGGLSSSCPQPPPPPPGNGAAAAACTNGAPPSPPGLTYNQCGAANPAASGGGAGGPAAAAAAGAAGAAGGAGGPGGALQREPVYNWQATKPTVQERFAFLFNNEVLSDVHFLVGKGRGSQRIPAHRFLYSDEVQIGPETVMTTLYTAKKYAVPALEAHCVEFLKKNLRADNAFMLLTQARLFDEPQLASLCLENIDKNTSDAINAEGFTDIDLDTLVAVLERDTLGIREVRLFNAVVRWSEAECQRQQLQVIPENKRKVLGKALSLIRFPLMTIEEFAAGPAQSGILTDREVVSLFLHFTVNPKPRVEFIDRPRCCLRGKECSISRFQQVESRWGYSGTSDRIRFSVNKRIFVVGFGLYGSIHGPTDYQVNIQIIHTDSNTVLGQNDTGFSCDGSSNTFRVMFKEPVEILPNVNYTACATLKGPDSHYGTKGLRKVIHESPTTGAKTCFTFCYAAGNNNGTSVEDGQIPEIIFYT